MKICLILVFVIVGLVAPIGQAQAIIPTPTPTKSAVPTPTPVVNAFFYSVKFLCGLEQPPTGIKPPQEPPVKPGNYATAVNVHNFHSLNLCVSKKAVVANPESLSQGPISPFRQMFLRPDGAFEIDCTDIVSLLGTALPPVSFIKGFVEIQSPVQLSVTGVYTTQTCQTSTTGGCTSLGQLAIAVVPEPFFIAPATTSCVTLP